MLLILALTVTHPRTSLSPWRSWAVANPSQHFSHICLCTGPGHSCLWHLYFFCLCVMLFSLHLMTNFFTTIKVLFSCHFHPTYNSCFTPFIVSLVSLILCQLFINIYLLPICCIINACIFTVGFFLLGCKPLEFTHLYFVYILSWASGAAPGSMWHWINIW